jgi:hypothetical protein
MEIKSKFCHSNTISFLKNNKIKPCGKPKNNRLIYSIHEKLSREQIEDIIKNCEIDFFSIDTTMFENVRHYYEMIDYMKEGCEKYGVNIGIIAELGGRKIKVENIVNNGQYDFGDIMNLKKGDTIKVIWNGSRPKILKSGLNNLCSKENIIYVNFKDIHKLVNKNDEIIINDNKGSLKVIEIKEDVIKNKSNINLLSSNNLETSGEINFTNHRKFSENRTVNTSFENLDNNDYTLITPKRNSIHLSQLEIPVVLHNIIDNNDKDSENSSERDLKIKKEKEEYEDLYKECDMMMDTDENQKDEIKFNEINSFIRNTARRFSINFEEQEKSRKLNNEDYSREEYQKRMTEYSIANSLSPTLDIRQKKLKLLSKMDSNPKKYEIICQVQYDCTINKNAFLFIPNADYKSLGIDLLTCREVNEISHLCDKEIDFICINIKDIDDINSIREILSENSHLKIIASIPDYYTLQTIDEILANTSGIVLSRTFGILNPDNQNSITHLTKYLITKCRQYSKPIFSFIDINEELLCKRTKIAHLNEIMYNIIDGMDGFFLCVNKLPSRTENFDSINVDIKAIKFIVNYFKSIRNDQFLTSGVSERNRKM